LNIGALKKPGTVRESSVSRIPLRVRWKDMIDSVIKSQNINKTQNETINNLSSNFEFMIQFSQVSSRVRKINSLIDNLKTYFDITNTEELYEKIHKDIDVILSELNLTIEHIRVSSSFIPENQANKNQEENIASKYEIEEKKKEMADMCRNFVNSSKNMISSSLTNLDQHKTYVIDGMEYLCLIVKGCLEITYSYSFKQFKLDETRTILTSLLSLTNTFRSTSFISFLTAKKQLKDENMGLLMKQATNLANEIGLLIKNFKNLL
jgi:uncharacterized pyridoxamine 5'-phosphate oxidase family protein